jgi:hypothetical protein
MWAGHNDSAFTMKTYVHASDDDLKQGREELAKIHRIAWESRETRLQVSGRATSHAREDGP